MIVSQDEQCQGCGLYPAEGATPEESVDTSLVDPAWDGTGEFCTVCAASKVVDLTAIRDELRALGQRAELTPSGGGIVTLYAGPVYRDSAGDTRHCASAGPGWPAADGRIVAYVDEFCIGADGGDDDYDYPTTNETGALVGAILYRIRNCA